MLIGSRNCRSCSLLGFFGHASFYHSLLYMDVFFLLDTRMDREQSKKLFLKFPFCESFVVSAEGQCGGLILFWNESSFKLRVVCSQPRFIHCVCTSLASGDDWFVTFVYMYPHKLLQAALWSDLLHLQPPKKSPLAAYGRF